MSEFKLLLISAGFEHGGNVTHRHFDGHKDLLVYPFESQLGNYNFHDFLSSIERVQYRYPEFQEGLSPIEMYENIIDEELKTFLRKRNGSKFRDVDLIMDENKRKDAFINRMGNKSRYVRKDAIEAFFRSTFDSWENYYVKPKDEMVYVGYSPAIGIDSNRILYDFPNAKIIHIIRNPFSAYRDTKRRPFPLNITKYLITWNIYHSTVNIYSNLYPNNVKIVRYEDIIANKESTMKDIAKFVGIEYSDSLLYPSWNSVKIEKDIAPWGTVLRADTEYNKSIIDELSENEKYEISIATEAIAKHFKYNEIEYLKKFYDK